MEEVREALESGKEEAVEEELGDLLFSVVNLTRLAGAHIAITNKLVLDEELLRQATGLELVCLAATGTNNVDLDAAGALGIGVCNIKGYCTASVVEHVFGSILNFAHKLSNYGADVRGGAWQKARIFTLMTRPINELSAMTLGIVGFGELGRGVAHVARAFGMDVIVSARPGTSPVHQNSRSSQCGSSRFCSGRRTRPHGRWSAWPRR